MGDVERRNSADEALALRNLASALLGSIPSQSTVDNNNNNKCKFMLIHLTKIIQGFPLSRNLDCSVSLTFMIELFVFIF